ncbi:MAG TPA: alpha/beta-type small acid-soluble spore protein [Clostridia bacterium]|nr:alpha/beta-type small acid-soluble spore protein [Clostridia bacterium]
MTNSNSSYTSGNSSLSSSSNQYQTSNRQNKQKLESFKSEVASSLGVSLKQGYNGDITARQAGSIGGEMVKRMIAYAANNMSPGNSMK